MNKFGFCKKCLYHKSHPLGLVLDDEGICSGCRVHEEKDKLDWRYRWKILVDLVNQYKISNSKNYDCIIPVTGSQDSYFTVYIVKEQLGLNPLLVNYNKYFNTPLGIYNLANLRTRFDCDILFQNINPETVKKITRTTMYKIGSIYWPIIAGHTAFPVQTAVRFKIPLIIWGAHQGMEQVGMFSHENEVEMTRRYRKEHDLLGYEADDLISNFDTLKESDIWQYRYPEDADISSIGIRGIYLNNYLRWDQKKQHEEMIKKYKYKTAPFERTFDTYDYVDCYNYMNLHDYIKLLKQGYSKVTDHASREIRHGRLNRENALKLVKKYEKNLPNYLNLFRNWLNINHKSLSFFLDQQRNLKYWAKTDTKEWLFNGWSVNNNLENDRLAKNSNIKFTINSSLSFREDPKYMIFGKGHI